MPDDATKTPYIQNSWQMPNFVTDYLDYYLTPPESKVLHRLLREILGYKKSMAALKNTISLSRLTDPVYSKENPTELFSLGCGLSRNTVQRILHQLETFNIITKHNKTTHGIQYGVNFDTNTYAWSALEDRERQRIEQNKARISGAIRQCQRQENGKWKNSQ